MRYEELRAAGVPVLHVPMGSIFSPGAVAAARKLRAYWREHRIKVVHCYDTSAALGVTAGRWAELPAVISSLLNFRDIMDWKTRAISRVTDRMSDAVVV